MKTEALIRVLIVEDDENDMLLILRQLKQLSWKLYYRVVDSEAGLLEALEGEAWDIVLSDYNLPEFDGARALELVRAQAPELPFIFVSGTIGEDKAVAAMRRGAKDYIMKDRLRRLTPAIERELKERAQREQGRIADRRRQQAEDRFRNVLTIAADAIISIDAQQRILIFNQGAERIFGYCADEILGRPLALLIPERFHSLHQRHIEEFARSDITSRRMSARGEVFGLRKDGSEFPAEASIARLDEEEGPTFTVILRDITERKRVEDEMRLLQTISLAVGGEADLYGALDVTLSQVCDRTGWVLGQAWVPNEQSGILECSPAWHCLDAGLEAFRSASLDMTFAPGVGLPGRAWSLAEPVWLPDVSRVGYFQRALVAAQVGLGAGVAVPVLADGTPVAILEFFLHTSREQDERMIESIRGVAAQLGVVIERKQAEDRLHHLAQHDLLTGLPNRLLFEDRLNQALADAHRGQLRVAVLFLDLDRFKAVNESLEHAAGDSVLRETGERLNACLDEGDTLARLSGDEFALLLTGVQHVTQVVKMAQRLQEAIRQPFHYQEHELFVSASLGIALYPDDDHSARGLLRDADIALYRAKYSGGDSYQFHRPEMTDQAMNRLMLDSALHQALNAGQFELHYQPQVCLKDGRIVGMEALLRWPHPSQGMIGPDHFIPIAEETGIIVPIGEWVLRTACAQLRQWLDQGLPTLRMAVNVSARQFRKQDLVGLAKALLEEYRLEPDWLELEITETVLMQSGEDSAVKLARLRELGLHIALDDFGTGYSSLSYLKRFPVTRLKIDRAFVNDIPADSDDTAITRAIIAMAQLLNIKVVAEGIETAEQMRFLAAQGCEFGQGYFLQRPVPEEQIVALFREGGGILGEEAL